MLQYAISKQGKKSRTSPPQVYKVFTNGTLSLQTKRKTNADVHHTLHPIQETQVPSKKSFFVATLSHSIRQQKCFCRNIVNKMSQQIIANAFEIISTTKDKKGKNFVVKEERQLYCNFLYVSQDSTTRIGQILITFWDQVCEYYNQPACKVKRLVKSLETKWGVIKQDITKFIGITKQWWHFVNLGLQQKKFDQKKLKLYKSKHIKKSKFCFIALLILSKRFSQMAKFLNKVHVLNLRLWNHHHQ